MKQNKIIQNQNRFFIELDFSDIEQIEFPNNIVHQISTVLKKRPGDYVFLFNGNKKEYKVILSEVTKTRVVGYVKDVIDFDGELDINIHLYQSLVEFGRMELVIQKSTELGVKHIFPVLSEKCKIKTFSENKKNRWKNIITESSEQSFRSEIMKLEPIIDFPSACKLSKGLTLFCNEYEQDFHINKINHLYLIENNIKDISIFIGPVSGYSDFEIQLANKSDLLSVSLGQRVLRTETAAIVAVSGIMSQLG